MISRIIVLNRITAQANHFICNRLTENRIEFIKSDYCVIIDKGNIFAILYEFCTNMTKVQCASKRCKIVEGQRLVNKTRGYLYLFETRKTLNGDASFRWSFDQNSAWGSIEPTIILITHPSLQLKTNGDSWRDMTKLMLAGRWRLMKCRNH